ncbi:hypothetical protein ACCO45_012729 [Purpureocillium lilacinum]|uniref:Uncharacterized protein n=1 Tax=Purpureocillium lilacinum TaxID=33203 RepID=A0ACC4D8T6_PURLI
MVAFSRAVVSLARDPFYAVPANLNAVQPGTILGHRTPPAPIAAFGFLRTNLEATHQLRYRTTDSHGNATVTVVTVLIPYNADKSKVLSYHVAEDSASIDCAPSYALQLEAASGPLQGTLLTQAELLLMEAALEQGWIVIVPDYLGPYSAFLANRLSGQAILDGIRATLNSADLTGILNPTITMWGYSGGSVVTGWAAELHPSYAPELNIAGAAVGGTVPDLMNAVTAMNNGPFAGIIPPGVLGLSAQYPELKAVIDKRLRPQYVEKFHKSLKQCLIANALDFTFTDVLGMFDDPNLVKTDPIIVKILKENALGQAIPKIPLFWYMSVLDEVSPIEATDNLVDKYCKAGASVEYLRDVASEHGSYAINGAPKAISWLKHVMNGHQPHNGCSQQTTVSTLLDSATLEVVPKLIADALLDLLGRACGTHPLRVVEVYGPGW